MDNPAKDLTVGDWALAPDHIRLDKAKGTAISVLRSKAGSSKYTSPDAKASAMGQEMKTCIDRVAADAIAHRQRLTEVAAGCAALLRW